MSFNKELYLEQGLIGNSIEMTRNTIEMEMKIFKKYPTYLIREV